jgi:hypothetical protein
MSDLLRDGRMSGISRTRYGVSRAPVCEITCGHSYEILFAFREVQSRFGLRRQWLCAVSDTSPSNKCTLLLNAPKPARQPQPGELLCELHIPAMQTVWRVVLRGHGAYGVEAQLLEPVELRRARTFRRDMDPTRTPRPMAIAWATEDRKAMAKAR